MSNLTHQDVNAISGADNAVKGLALLHPTLCELRAILAAHVSMSLDAEGISVRQAQKLTGIDASDFSRIRQGKLRGFTIDRLLTILDGLNQDVTIAVSVAPRISDEQASLPSSLSQEARR